MQWAHGGRISNIGFMTWGSYWCVHTTSAHTMLLFDRKDMDEHLRFIKYIIK